MMNFYEPYRVLVVKTMDEAAHLEDALTVAAEEIEAQLEMKQCQMQEDPKLADDAGFSKRLNRLIQARSYLYDLKASVHAR